MTVTADIDSSLDDILCRWHQWRSRYRPSRGYNGRALVVGEYRISRQYDDINGAIDDEIEGATMRTVEFHASELDRMHYMAICWIAMGLVVGAVVYRNPRLPDDKAELDELCGCARRALARRLVAAGIL